MNQDKTLNSMRNMLKISREYTHIYEYKGNTSYENSFKSLKVLNLFQQLEEQNHKLHQLLLKNKGFELEFVRKCLENAENIDVKCMSTIELLKEELQSFLKNKTLTIEQLNKPHNYDNIKMDIKYQVHASEYLTEIRGELVQFEKDIQEVQDLINFLNHRNPEDLYKYDLELQSLYKKLESSTETLIKFNEKFNENSES